MIKTIIMIYVMIGCAYFLLDVGMFCLPGLKDLKLYGKLYNGRTGQDIFDEEVKVRKGNHIESGLRILGICFLGGAFWPLVIILIVYCYKKGWI